MFGDFSVATRVFKLENGNLGWELKTTAQYESSKQAATAVVRGQETCGDSREGWTRLARVATQAWREQTLQMVSKW